MIEPCSRLDIIPDIHGDVDRLTQTLAQLDYESATDAWRHPTGRVAAFLGDFIDGGHANAEVIDIVMRMERAGSAIAIMGNHELNALLYSQLGFTASGSDMLGYREDMLVMLMAGRAAEQIVIGKVSSGSGGSDDSDLARATKMALAIERSLGFGAIQTLLYRNDKDPTAVLDGNPDLAARIHARLETAFARAVEVLSENRDQLSALTKALFDAQALDGEAVKRLLKHGCRAP